MVRLTVTPPEGDRSSEELRMDWLVALPCNAEGGGAEEGVFMPCIPGSQLDVR